MPSAVHAVGTIRQYSFVRCRSALNHARIVQFIRRLHDPAKRQDADTGYNRHLSDVTIQCSRADGVQARDGVVMAIPKGSAMSPETLTPRNFRLECDSWGQLVLIGPDGTREAGVVPSRAFPVSDKGHWVSLCNSEGHEVLAIPDLAEVPGDVRQVLEDALAEREFVPVILKIYSATFQEPLAWRVETDRGPTSFLVSSEADVRRIEPAQASVTDSHGIRYWIPDIHRLDRASRRLLEHFL